MINVLIYEDNAQMRDSLTMLLDGTEGLHVVGAFRDCLTAAAQVTQLRPDVILMDIDLPLTNGIEGVRRIREVNSVVKIMMLTVFDDNQNIFDALQAGANGYLLKKTPPAKLIEYVQDVQSGGAPMTSSVATQVLQMFARQYAAAPPEYNLSDREKAVLQLLVNGYSYKMIATEMLIAVDTVRSHIRHIYEKLHVNSKSEAVAKAFRDNIIR
jgi:DNA-binding NarL/FixJ family response regulator